MVMPQTLDEELARQRGILSQRYRHRATTTALITTEPRPDVAEEDMCWLCGELLPPKGADGDEADRVAHVTECIKQQEHRFNNTTESGSPAPPSTDGNASSGPTSISAAGPSSFSNNHQARARGISAFKASEKDCIGAGGEERECIICLEEFEVGDRLGLLECFCIFHEVRMLSNAIRSNYVIRLSLTCLLQRCIRDWWTHKGPGSCPTHQLHD
jgi:hypothetical protein